MLSTILGVSDQGSWTYTFPTSVLPTKTFLDIRNEVREAIQDIAGDHACGLVVANGALRLELHYKTRPGARREILHKIISILKTHGCLNGQTSVKVVEDGQETLETTI